MALDSPSPILSPGDTLRVMQRTSFSHEAAEVLKKDLTPDIDIQFAPHISQELQARKGLNAEKLGVWDHVLQDSEYGLLPFENSSPKSGVVWEHMELLNRRQVEILGEVNLSVHMNVGGLPGADPTQAKRVFSHQQGLLQCSQYLDAIPGIEKVVSPNTAAAAQEVKRLGSVENIALASRLAIEDQELEVLAQDVANLKGDKNITQFFLIGRNGHSDLPNVQKDYHAMLVRLPERVGALSDLLGVLKQGHINLTSIHSRVDPKFGGEYGFFIEMENRGYPEELALLKEQLEAYDVASAVDWIGSWDDRLFSQMGPDEYHLSQAPIVKGEMWDVRKRFHRVMLLPNDYRGVLHDILNMIANARVTLTSLQSHTRGPKTYSFSIDMDAHRSNQRKLKLLQRQLSISRALMAVDWKGSSDEPFQTPAE